MTDHAEAILKALADLAAGALGDAEQGDADWDDIVAVEERGRQGVRMLVAERDAATERAERAERRAEGWVQHDTEAYEAAMRRQRERAERAEESLRVVVKEDGVVVSRQAAQLVAAREALTEDREKWSFDTALYVADRLLAENYGPGVFDGSSGDLGPVFIVRLREALAAVRAALAASGTPPEACPLCLVPAARVASALADRCIRRDEIGCLAVRLSPPDTGDTPE